MGHGDDQQHAGGTAPRGQRTPRLLGWGAVVLTVVLVAAILAGYALYRDIFGKIQHVKVTGLGHRPPGYNRSLNLLVIGSDTRKGRNASFGAHVAGQRSDTIMVVHLSPGLRRAVVLSIPRDSVVPVLACPGAPGAPGQAAQPGQIEQINETFSAGGPGCLWKTIEQTTGIRLDHFAELNFTGFEHVINDLGGVSICLPYPISDRRSKLHLSAGVHHVMGPEALAYWRVRYIGVGSDLERIQRDQYLMASVAQEAKRANLLGSPARVFRIARDVAASLTTDSGLSESALINLAQRLRTLPLHAVHFVQVPVVTYPANPNWVQWPARASTLFRAIARDKKLPGEKRPRHGTGGGQEAGVTARRHGGREAGVTARRNSDHSPPPSLSGLSRRYGGISAGANVCHDSGAFRGPLGGH
jgi:LCP family protein required for cell wall assembly